MTEAKLEKSDYFTCPDAARSVFLGSINYLTCRL